MDDDTKKALGKVYEGKDYLLTEKEKGLVASELNSLNELISDTDKLLQEIDIAEEARKWKPNYKG